MEAQKNQPTPKRRLWLWVPLGILLIIGLAIGGFVLWASQPIGVAMPEAIEAAQSDEVVNVTDSNWLAFIPATQPPKAGFIFLQGAKVEAAAYAPIAKQIAAEGYVVVIPYNLFDLAVLSPNMSDIVLESFNAVDTWAIGGHSLGGAIAARYAGINPEEIEGLVLLGAYPAMGNMPHNDIEVLSLYATNDGFTTPEEVTQEYAEFLPSDTRYVAIEGGNHSQFGYYGLQDGDNEATISREEQTQIIVDEIVAFLEGISS